MFKRIANIVLVAIMGIACFACRGKKAEAIKLSGTVIEISDSLIQNASPEIYDFGRLKQGETAVREFVIRNAGSRPFVISKVDGGCSCLASEYDKRPIRTGETTSLSITFYSAGYYGEIIRDVQVMTSLSGKPYIFYVESNVTE